MYAALIGKRSFPWFIWSDPSVVKIRHKFFSEKFEKDWTFYRKIGKFRKNISYCRYKIYIIFP